MRINLTLAKVLEKWNNWNYYAVNEGGGNIDISLSVEDAKKYEII